MIVTVVNLKGGVGKTTSAIALATAASRAGHVSKVLDADSQSSASLWAMSAEQEGEALPFEVSSANIATLRRLTSAEDEWVFIDCPPTGNVTDEAVNVADVVIVPTAPAGMDFQQTWATVSTLIGVGKPYAILLTRILPHTRSLASALADLDAQGASYFDAHIPQREDLKNYFGHSFGDALYHYDDVFAELEEMMS